ncbi:MAG TPA: hypothetical protein VLX29_04555 [Nitrospirota bacterium]|nr:hypothetical protein [Nitrospirota bacterium]
MNKHIRPYVLSLLQKGYDYFTKKRSDKTSISIAKNLYIGKQLIFDLIKTEHSDWDRKYIANLASTIINKFFLISLSGEQRSFYDLHKDSIESLYIQTTSNDTLKHRYNLHLMLLRYFYGKDINILSADDPVKAELLKPEIDILTKDDVAKLSKVIHAEFNAVRKASKRQMAFEHSTNDIDENSKIDIVSPTLPVYIGLFSLLFLCTGYIYNQLFLGYFGVDLSKFYTFGDHLSSSADKFHLALFPVLAGILVSTLFIPDYLRSEVSKGATSGNMSSFHKVSFYALLIAGTLAVVGGYFAKSYLLMYSSLVLLVLPLLVYILGRSMKYFKNPAQTYFLCITLALFFMNIMVWTGLDIHHVMKDDAANPKSYNVVLTKDIKIDDRFLVMLALNERHLFYYDKKNEKTIIIPAGKIVKIEGRMKPGYGLYQYLMIDP